LQASADDLRARGTTSLVTEYRCICNGLTESDKIEDFNYLAHEYRIGIGLAHLRSSTPTSISSAAT
jgi:hypothetical protein